MIARVLAIGGGGVLIVAVFLIIYFQGEAKEARGERNTARAELGAEVARHGATRGALEQQRWETARAAELAQRCATEHATQLAAKESALAGKDLALARARGQLAKCSVAVPEVLLDRAAAWFP